MFVYLFFHAEALLDFHLVFIALHSSAISLPDEIGMLIRERLALWEIYGKIDRSHIVPLQHL